MTQPLWQNIRERKIAEVASRIPQEWQIPSSALPSSTTSNVLSIPRTCGILTPREIHITEAFDANLLLKEIRERKYTSVEVTTAYGKRATIAHQLTNCLTEPLFEQALARATFLDQHLATTGQPLGPLHGLPISVKDTFHLAGIDSSIGIAALCFRPALENSPIVQLLLDAGAVIHCKTNVPQTLLALDSTNNIFGRTLNPENRQQWTAGGSSGGEAVLVKMRGSVMGVGTDVGGSIRIPAMCNGIYGFKPSVGRVPAGGQETGQLPAAGKVGMESSVGPIARCLDDIALFMEVVEAARMWERDSSIVPGRWWDTRNDISKSPLKKPLIGIIWTDGNVNPLPPIRKVLQEMKQSLQAAGISIIDIPAPVFSHCQPLANKFFTAEGSAHIFSLLSSTSEALIPWLSTRLKPNRPTSLSTFRDLQAQRSALHDEFLKIFKTPDGQTIDALICPVAPHPVPPLDRWNSVGYTSAFVLLDYPAASIPVRRVRACDLEGEMGAEVLRGWDRVNRALWDQKTVDRNAYLGSPLSIQVVAPRLQERRLWDAMVVIERAIRDGKIGRDAKL